MIAVTWSELPEDLREAIVEAGELQSAVILDPSLREAWRDAKAEVASLEEAHGVCWRGWSKHDEMTDVARIATADEIEAIADRIEGVESEGERRRLESRLQMLTDALDVDEAVRSAGG